MTATTYVDENGIRRCSRCYLTPVLVAPVYICPKCDAFRFDCAACGVKAGFYYLRCCTNDGKHQWRRADRPSGALHPSAPEDT